jgi:hypothetical protein
LNQKVKDLLFLHLNQSWDEKETLFKMSGKFVKTTNITQSIVVDKQGEWTSVLAAAVLILRDNGTDRADKPKESDKPPAPNSNGGGKDGL